jgi:hypothetical protein
MNLARPRVVRAQAPCKSHGEPRLIVRTLCLMASHGDRGPRLTLKAGRREGR